MNPTLEVIQSRRSIRKYRQAQITEAELEQLLQAAIYAPSARNQQKWHFSVIQDCTLLDRMVPAIKDGILRSGNEFLMQRVSDPAYHTFYHAPTVILISADENSVSAQIDCGAAAENIALAGESLNIGSCLITSSHWAFASDNDKSFARQLGIPDGYTHILSIAIGYKAEPNPPAPERNLNVVTYLR